MLAVNYKSKTLAFVAAISLSCLLGISACTSSTSSNECENTGEQLSEVVPSTTPVASDKENEYGYAWSLPRVGNASVLGLRVTFPDYSDTANKGFDEGDTFDAFQTLFDESGISHDGFPYDNLNAYYERASDGKLTITGQVFDYQAAKPKTSYEIDVSSLVIEALSKMNSEGIDLTQFDGNGDGIIDCIYLHVAGENGSWGGTWWSHTEYCQDGVAVSGMKLGNYIVLHRPSNALGAARNMIHETGHALGLPDLYLNHHADMTAEDGSLLDSKTFDMMDAAVGDIDGFCKEMLGWIDEGDTLGISFNEDDVEREFVVDFSSFSSNKTLRSDNAVVIANITGQTGEQYIIEYDCYEGNNSIIVGEGKYQEPLPAGFRILRINNDYLSSRKNIVEAVDIDSEVRHVVNDGIPTAAESPYNCLLKEKQYIVLDGDIILEAQQCRETHGVLRITS